jgi:hypothetical protein
VNGIREAIANRLWKTWIVTVEVLIVGINKLFYCKTPREQRQKSSPHWEIAANRFETLMSALGDWIQVQTQPSNSRKRRIIATGYRYQRTTQFAAMSVLAMLAHATVSTERETRFDTDSADIGIDNRCSACISHVESDLEGPLMHCNRVVKGFCGSRTRNVKMGTLKWSWEDDQGDATTFRIPNSYYVPDGGVRLLSPNIGRKRSRVKAHDSQNLISADAANALSLHRNAARQRTATGVYYIYTKLFFTCLSNVYF